jgi:hypothetical protein
MAAKLKHGVTGASGGKREGAGRTPDWLKAECDKILDRCELFKFLGDIIEGKDVEQAVGDQGETISIPPAVRDRLKAAEMLLDRRFGRAQQTIEHSGDIGSRLVFIHPPDGAK